MMELTNAQVSWVPQGGGEPVDLGQSATVTMHFVREPVDHFAPLVNRGWFQPMAIRGRFRLTPAGYRVLFGQTHPRIRRMHMAYSRKRGRGRW
jgi:hypothetical protein